MNEEPKSKRRRAGNPAGSAGYACRRLGRELKKTHDERLNPRFGISKGKK